MTFLEWNDKLAAHFFRPEAAGRQVFLFVTEDLLDELGAGTSDTQRGFISVVKAGHPWRRSGYHSLCQNALHCHETWRFRDLRYPAYIAYLGLFVLAAGREGDFASHAYYPRLRALVGEPGHGMLPDFDQMWRLWEDLERWATYEQGGELGLFTYRSAGGGVHVGVPRAQTILTEHERRALPGIFAAARLDPTSSPPESELRRALRTHGSQMLRQRTLSLLNQENSGEREFLDVLTSTVREELEHWDGYVEEADQPAGRSVYGSLRLCAALDRVARTARFTLRCSMNREFPEAGLVLKRPGSGDRFCCEGELLHWSTQLQDAGSHARVDGTRFNWSAGVELREERLGWRFRMQGSPVRIFLNGESEGLRGLVEVQQLSPGVPFVLAARSDCWPRLDAWGKASCQQFDRVSVRQGMPEGWGLYRAAAAQSDDQVRNDFPNLAFPHSVRVLLRGGIGSGRRNTYFRFGMPALLLEGTKGEERVCCNGVELRPEEGIYHLPPNLPAGMQLPIEVRRGEEVLKRQSFSLIDDFDWQWSAPHQLFDRFGSPVDSSQVNPLGVAGAVLAGTPPAKAFFSPPASCFQGRRVFFVGPVPGQIISWPSEELPLEWSPVWAIPMMRRGRAIFCGVDLCGAPAVAGSAASYSRKKVRLWKEVLHYRRKRIEPPAGVSLRRLWQQYREMACRVRA